MDDDLVGGAAAELVGTFLVTFAAAGSLIVDAGSGSRSIELGAFGVAAVTGVGYALAVALTRRRSGGHVNPAVSVAAWLAGRVSAIRAASYAVAQLAGGVLAAAVLTSLLPRSALDAATSGATTLAPSIGMLTAVTWELVITFVYTLVAFATVLDRPLDRAGSLAAGGAAFLAVALALPFTGASMNPARSLGPALLASSWTGAWVYVVGPILGASLAAGLHDGVLREVPRPGEPASDRAGD